VEIVLRNQPDDRQKLLSGLEAFANEHHLSHSVHHAADLALEEHLTNITRYAYDAARAHDVVVRFGIELDCLAIQVEDEGKPFDPLQRPEVDTSLPLDQKPVGGLGIHLIRQFMDEVQYRREGNKNVLTMRKRLV
jgi:anti-sigma regulatory factor (Ser/Thr protein kinase)